MKPLTKEQAIKISELHKLWYAKHPKATREQLVRAFYRVRRQVLEETKNNIS